MRACGIDMFRFLCFDWAALEPEDDRWTFAWAHDVMRLAEEHGLQVQLTIPTAGPPSWLMLEHPEITQNGSSRPGTRREYCPASRTYRRYCRRLAGRIVDELGGYGNVWGYQIDNELGFNISKTVDSHERWIAWLKQRHGKDICDLNEAWFLKFWSREYTQWEQVQWEHGGSPESIYDLKHFYSDLITEFMEDILSVLREKAPNKVVSTNYMGNFDMVDYWRMSRDLDVVGYDYYKWIYTLEGGALADDLMRNLKQQKFWRYESGCDTCLPTEWLVLQTIKGWARGMEGDMRFPWRQFHGGSEQVLAALVDTADRTTRAWEATRLAAAQLRDLPVLTMQDFATRVALVNNWRCGWALQSLHGHPSDYFYVVEGVYKSLFRLGVLCDVTAPGGDWSAYDVIFFPSHPLIDEALADRLKQFVASGGTVVAMPISFTHTDKVQLATELAPLGLVDLFGASIRESHLDRNDIDNETTHLGHDVMAMTAVKVAPPLRYKLRCSTLAELDGTLAERWFTWLDADGAEIIATYAESHYRDQAAITCRSHDSGGSAWLIGCFLQEPAQRALFARIISRHGIESIPPSDPGVEVIPLKRYIIYLNFTDESRTEPSPHGSNEEGTIELNPYGFAVIERNRTI